METFYGIFLSTTLEEIVAMVCNHLFQYRYLLGRN